MRIYKTPSQILTKKAKNVTDFGDDFQKLINDMFATMMLSGGVGLAAPQIGESLNLFVVEYLDMDKKIAKRYTIVNPKIEWRSFDRESEIESCLSIPSYSIDKERSKSIGISCLDRYGNKSEIEVSGYLARIFQHEIDHLNGILIY